MKQEPNGGLAVRGDALQRIADLLSEDQSGGNPDMAFRKEDGMKVLRIAALLAVCGVALAGAGQAKPLTESTAKPATQQENIPSSIADSVSSTLQFVEGNFIGIAEAMPESRYSFVPTAGKFDDVRSFGEQVKHVACAQFAFFNEFEGKKPPEDCEKGGHEPARTKPELIQYLKDSFDYSNRVLATLTAKNALDRVEGRYAGPNTKLGISVVAVWHITDHYGQLVEYLRMNGIVPPMTQKYGVKVR
jgi:uncharacterized damage-inducible protein DinB